jgi:hypothetical protein
MFALPDQAGLLRERAESRLFRKCSDWKRQWKTSWKTWDALSLDIDEIQGYPFARTCVCRRPGASLKAQGCLRLVGARLKTRTVNELHENGNQQHAV